MERRSRFQTMIAVMLILAGLGLLVGKIVADGEPGALPLLMLLMGTVWLIVIRFQAGQRRE